ncbi:hypothetical protein RRG08_004244 [Elysia crispata]|uniref:Uncharacterized protein n=1 Tax=Elysia crispata TaxID=231223 RepID=A0AAE0Y9Z6_9GAST|nr:hypothetical protein RRG08_004244 [Elysia crispata]
MCGSSLLGTCTTGTRSRTIATYLHCGAARGGPYQLEERGMKLEGSEEINDAISCYEFYKIAGNMWNATFTAKGDHIAWTQVEQFTKGWPDGKESDCFPPQSIEE